MNFLLNLTPDQYSWVLRAAVALNVTPDEILLKLIKAGQVAVQREIDYGNHLSRAPKRFQPARRLRVVR